MKKVVIGYLYDEPHLCRDEKSFIKLSKKHNIELVLINIDKDIDEGKIKEQVKNCKIIYNSSGDEFAVEIVKMIESFGKRVIDSSKNNYYSEDKWMFYVKCEEHKIPTPKTILLSENINIAKRELKEFSQWPVILKRIYGTMGQYVDKADNLTQAEKVIKKFWKKANERSPIIAQEFIKSPSYRITMIGDKIVQTTLKEAKGWKVTGNNFNKTDFKKFELDKTIEKLSKKISKIIGIKICGIDFAKKDNKWLVIEVNAQPAFDFFLEEREKLIEEVLLFLKKSVQ